MCPVFLHYLAGFAHPEPLGHVCPTGWGAGGGVGNLHPKQSPRHPPHAQEGARVGPQGFCCLYQ